MSLVRRSYKPPQNMPLAVDPRAFDMFFDYDDDDDIEEPESVKAENGIAVIDVYGPLEQHDSWFWESYEHISERLSAAYKDAGVKAIVLRIDSPGGDVAGMIETVRAMRAAKTKPVIAYVDERACSAGYAIATIADEIYMPETAEVGSVGAIAVAYDVTAMHEKMGLNVRVIASGTEKADGHPDVPLTDEVVGRIQGRVNQLADLFFTCVSESRPVTAEALRGLQARVVYGPEAIDAGLVDGIMGYRDLMAMLAPTENRSEGSTMSLKLAAKKALADARAALRAATDDDERERLGTVVASSERVYSAACACDKRAESTAADGDKEEEKADKGEGETPDGEPCDPDVDDDCEPVDKEEEAESEGDETAAAQPRGVLAFVQRITGHKDAASQLGALRAMHEASGKVASLSKRVADLEQGDRKASVEAMIKQATAAGKIVPAQKAWATKLGMRDPAELKAYVDSAPAMFATADGATRAMAPAVGGVTAEEEKVARAMGIKPEDLKAHKEGRTINAKQADAVTRH